MVDSIWMLLLSDLHLGSSYSIWPPGLISSLGTDLKLNIGQEYLWNNFLCIINEIKKLTGENGVDIVCEVGDSIYGPNEKQKGEHVVEPDLAFQGKAAIDVIKMVKSPRAKFFKFRGSQYHVGEQAETEEWIGEELDAEKDDMGHRCWIWLPALDVAGVVFDMAHSQSVVQAYRSMPLERERYYSNQIPESIKKKPDLIVRAHAHVSGYVEMDGDASLGLPPMQLQTPYAKGSKTPNRLFSKYLGVALIEILPPERRIRGKFQLYWLRFLHPPLAKYTYEPEEKRKSWLTRILQ